jgi:hypothetical protein
MNTRSLFLSALIAGVVIGLLGNLPVLNLINCFLCIWVWVGGFLAVMLYRRYEQGVSPTTGQGAGIGALAGLIGAVVGIMVNLLTSFISAPVYGSIADLLNIQGDLPFQSGNFVGALISAFFFFALDVVLYPIFGALSGMITASLTKK